jgi:Peptidase family M28
MAAWVKRLVHFGIRRPGYAGDHAAARWIKREFTRAGLRHVHLDPVPVNRWKPKRCRVTWWSNATPAAKARASCFALPFSQPRANLSATVVLDTGKNDINGAIGVVDDQFVEIPQSVLAQQALAVVAPKAWVDTDQQPIPFGIRNGDLFSDFFGPTMSRGGVGMIGILDGLGVDRYYAPYTGKNVDLPAVWLGEAAGKRLTAAMAAGPTTATMTVTATRERATSANVVGTLPASSEKWVVVGSHHDAPWASAVEDASGIAQVLAQAQYWAGVPKAKRPHQLMFIATAGHMSGAAGSIAVLARYPKILDRTVLEVHLEHVARRAHMTPSGLEVTKQPETRWWFVTKRPDLQQLVVDALHAEGMHRDLVLPAVGFFGGDVPLSDAAPFSLAGVPVVSLITTPLYLFDPRDTVDKIDNRTTETVRDAATRMIAATKTLTTTRTG